MANDLTVPGGGDVNPYVAYGMSSGRTGTLLKFSKGGEWTAGTGDDSATMANGHQLVALMQDLALVWTKWSNQKPVDRIVTLVASGKLPPGRNTLGDTNESQWDFDDEGQRRDPWQATHELPLVDRESGEQYVYSTASVGGRGALSKLSTAYGRSLSRYPHHDPVVALGSGGYEHKIKSRGWINTPSLKIVAWEPREGDPPPPRPLKDDMNDGIPF